MTTESQTPPASAAPRGFPQATVTLVPWQKRAIVIGLLALLLIAPFAWYAELLILNALFTLFYFQAAMRPGGLAEVHLRTDQILPRAFDDLGAGKLHGVLRSPTFELTTSVSSRSRNQRTAWMGEPSADTVASVPNTPPAAAKPAADQNWMRVTEIERGTTPAVPAAAVTLWGAGYGVPPIGSWPASITGNDSRGSRLRSESSRQSRIRTCLRSHIPPAA